MSQSAKSRPQAESTLRIDTEETIATEWRFADGAETGWHRHALDYVVVPLGDGVLEIESADGTSRAELTNGIPYFRKAGVEHNVVNASGREFAFLEIELKR
ncbi:cupin domain-containing protein [Marivibrio halodurans]|uniref:Cupin domain-containing protein n=1 Tax=Marivibrio halodurans TaxID=2039722 RepID=A0A8J7S4J9_9PROT|nr:cupin domain-containing protein [Marivibrio halodurans]MBP5858433.1 cupin domain-containing protein [Marivibrio halodurans]